MCFIYEGIDGFYRVYFFDVVRLLDIVVFGILNKLMEVLLWCIVVVRSRILSIEFFKYLVVGIYF